MLNVLIIGGGPVIVDKIYPGSICVISNNVPVGYRIGFCKKQKLCLALFERWVGHSTKRKDILYMSKPTDWYSIYTSAWIINWKFEYVDNLIKDPLELRFHLTKYDEIHTNGYQTEVVLEDDYVYHVYIKDDEEYSMYNHRYVGVFCDYYSNISGYFEKNKDGWTFHSSNLMIGNSGTRKIESDHIINRSLAYHLNNQFLSYQNFFALLHDIDGYYGKNVSLKTQHNYNLYVKLRSKKKKMS